MSSKEIRVAIVGVGNCANSLIQGVTYYKDAAADKEIPGLMHAVLGGYHVRDVNFVAAFDVDAKKVGLDIADAMGQVRTTPSSSVMLRRPVSRFFVVILSMALVVTTKRQSQSQPRLQSISWQL